MRRVVITGLGAVTPVGNNVPQMWENLKTGVNGIAAITQFDASQMKVRIAGEVKNLQPELFLSPQEVRRLDRTAILALIAAQEAYQDSQLEKAVIDPYRFGVYVTSGIGGVNNFLFFTSPSPPQGRPTPMSSSSCKKKKPRIPHRLLIPCAFLIS